MFSFSGGKQSKGPTLVANRTKCPAGKQLILTCKSSMKRARSYMFLKNGKVVKLQMRNPTLMIKRANKRHAGSWSCIARGRGKKKWPQSKKLKITITGEYIVYYLALLRGEISKDKF